MKLLCIILNYKTAEMTLDAVKAARAALAHVEGGYRIDVVDNDSQDGSFEKLSAWVEEAGWPDVEVMASGHNGGFGAGNNFAMRKALASDDPPELLYILNSDAFPAEDAIKALVDFMDAHPEVGITGSYIHGTDDVPHLTAFRSRRSKARSSGRSASMPSSRLWPEHEVPIQPMPERTRQVDWLAGASMMIRRTVLEEVGFFDETFFLYFEETDLCRRARPRRLADLVRRGEPRGPRRQRVDRVHEGQAEADAALLVREPAALLREEPRQGLHLGREHRGHRRHGELQGARRGAAQGQPEPGALLPRLRELQLRARAALAGVHRHGH